MGSAACTVVAAGGEAPRAEAPKSVGPSRPGPDAAQLRSEIGLLFADKLDAPDQDGASS